MEVRSHTYGTDKLSGSGGRLNICIWVAHDMMMYEFRETNKVYGVKYTKDSLLTEFLFFPPSITAGYFTPCLVKI